MSAGRVLGYGDLIEKVANDTGVPKAHVRKVIDSMGEAILDHLKAAPENRARVGNLCTLYSRMTTRRMVNNPQSPGEQIVSEPHLVMRVAVGTKTKEILES